MRVREPLASGDALVAMMARHRPRPAAVTVWPLGQAGFRVEFPECVLYFDLYLSNHCEAVLPRPFDHRRGIRSPLDAAQISDADVVVCSHSHLDHCDWPTIRTISTSSPSATLVTPMPNVPTVRDLDWPSTRVIGSTPGETFSLSGLSLTPFAVAHDDYDQGDEGFPYQGYVVTNGRVSIAHVGDARLDERLVTFLKQFDLDLLMVPINGRSTARKSMGFAGNMNAEEAALLARSVRARHVVPMHYDMFAQNTDPGALASFLESISTPGSPAPMVVQVGECFTVGGRTGTES